MATIALTKNNIKRIEFLKKKGFHERRTCFALVTDNVTHWAFIYDDESVHLYSYYTNDSEMKDVYNTGCINVIDNEEFETIAAVLIDNNI